MAAEVIGSVSLELLLDTTKFNQNIENLNNLINKNLNKSFSTLERTMQSMSRTQVEMQKSYQKTLDLGIQQQKTYQEQAKSQAKIAGSMQKMVSSYSSYHKEVQKGNREIQKTQQQVLKLKTTQEKVKISANNLERTYANVKSTANYALSQALKNTSKLLDRSKSLYQNSKKIGAKSTWNGMLTSLSSAVYLAKNLYSAFENVATKVKEIADVGGQLTEVQNVIDTKLGTRASDVTNWALSDTTKNTFGMNSLTSSEFVSRFGGMMTTNGFSDNISAEYAKVLTGLVADESSLYNKEYDETFTNFFSGIFNNRATAMSKYGVDLYVASLQEYALAKGITKSYNEMSNQEKICLRLAKTIETLSGDVGDFSRTQNTWANQTRMLSENFEQLKMVVGQGLAVALTPVVKILNVIMEKLITLAMYFRNFVVSIFADESLKTGIAQWEDELTSFEDEAESTAESVSNSFKSMFLPLDDIVQLNKSSGSSNTSFGGGVDQAFLDLLDESIYEKVYGKWEQIEKDSVAWLEQLTSKTDGLWGALNRFKDFMKSEEGLPRFLQICKDFASNIDWEKINTSLDNFWESAEPLAELAWDGLMDFYECFLAPLGNWTLNEGLTSLLDIITKFNTDIDWERINTSLENFWKALEPKVEAMGRGFIDFLEDLADWAIKFINDNCPAALDAVTNFLNNTDDSTFEKIGYGIGVVATAFLGLKVALEMLSPLLDIGSTVLGWATNSSLLSGVSGATTTGGASAAASGGGLMATLTNGSITGLSGTAALGAGAGAVAVIAAGIAMIVDGLHTLWTEVPQFKEDMLEILSDIGESFGEFWTTIKDSFSILGESFNSLFESLDLSNKQLAGLWGVTQLYFGNFATLIDFVLSLLGHAIEYIAIQLSNIVQMVQGVLQVIFGIVSFDGQMILDGLSNICSGFTDLLVQTFTTGLNFLLDVVELFLSSIGDIGEMFSEGFKNSFLQGWENVKQTIWDTIGGFAIDVQNWLNKTFGLNLDFASNMPSAREAADIQDKKVALGFKYGSQLANYAKDKIVSYNVKQNTLSHAAQASSSMKEYETSGRWGKTNDAPKVGTTNTTTNQPIVINSYMQVDGDTLATTMNTYNAKMYNRF